MSTLRFVWDGGCSIELDSKVLFRACPELLFSLQQHGLPNKFEEHKHVLYHMLSSPIDGNNNIIVSVYCGDVKMLEAYNTIVEAQEAANKCAKENNFELPDKPSFYKDDTKMQNFWAEFVSKNKISDASCTLLA